MNYFAKPPIQALGFAFFGLMLLAPNASAQSAKPVVQPASIAAGADEWHYTVAVTDTLIGLIKQFMKPTVDWREVQKLNQVADPKRLVPGSKMRIKLEWLRADAAVAQVVHAQGSIQVLRNNVALASLAAGAELRGGDSISTGEQSTLSLRFADGARLLVGPQSKVLIESLLSFERQRMTESRLRVDQGGVDVQVNPAPSAASKFQVRTPTLNLGVRGTDFRVRFDGATQVARSEVLDGRVAAGASKGEVAVDAGFGTMADAGGVPLAPKKLMPAPALSGLGAQLDQVPLRFSWQSESGASAYRAQIFSDRTFSRLLLDGLFREPSAQWADLPDGRYVLRVRSVDNLGLEGMAKEVDVALKARPFAPTPSQPANRSTIAGEGLLLQWAAQAQAERYRVQISERADFSTFRIDRGDVNASELRVNLPPGVYFWRLASIARGDDQGPFGVGQSFTLEAVPVQKDPQAPPVQAPSIGRDSINLRFDPRDPGQAFQVQIASDPEFKNLVLDKTFSDPSARVPKPGAGVYYLRVQAIRADGKASGFGPARRFEVEGHPFSPLHLLPFLLFIP